jgi:hypothetical protein
MAKKKEAKPSKADKAANGGPKKSKIPRPVQGRGFATFGLIALAPIAWMLLKGQLDLESAAQRAVIVLGGLMLLERLIAPLVMAVLNSSPKRNEVPTTDEDIPAESA